MSEQQIEHLATSLRAVAPDWHVDGLVLAAFFSALTGDTSYLIALEHEYHERLTSRV